MKKGILFICGVFIFLPFSLKAQEHSYKQYFGAVHVHTIKNNEYKLDELAENAKKLGIKILVITDHDLFKIEYGLFPFRNLIKKSIERPSVLKLGVERYLKSIEHSSKKYPELIFIPGVESLPFYYITGSYFKGDLCFHDLHKHMLFVGIRDPEVYKNLPLISNGFSLRYTKYFYLECLPFFIAVGLSIFLISWQGIFKLFGFFILIIGSMFMINYHPFRSSLFDQYQGEIGIAPHQELIDYINENHGLTYWAHPEAHGAFGEYKSAIKYETKPYKKALLESKKYTGFAAIYEDTFTVTNPGDIWDQTLIEYCQGKREEPVWGYGEIDYHSENFFQAQDLTRSLDNILTVFLLKSFNYDNVISALQNGKIYMTAKNKDSHFLLEEFSLSNGSNYAISGDNIIINESHPTINIKVVSSDGKIRALKLFIIKMGKVIKIVDGQTPLTFIYKDDTQMPGENFFYRLEIKVDRLTKLLSNPIFVKRR